MPEGMEDLRRENRALRKENSRLKRRVAALEKQLRELQSAPRPSPFAKFEVRPPHDPKPRGPPPDHEPHHRETPEPDETLEVTLPKCPDCRTPLGEPLEYVDHTVEDIVPGRRVVRRYLQARYRCPGCGKFHLARPPGVLPNSRFGPNLALLVVMLRLRAMSVSNVLAFLTLAFGLEMTGASVLNLEQRVARELKPLYMEIRKALRTRPVVQGDETGWKVNGVQHWLWAFSSGKEALFVADRWRAHTVPQWVLGRRFGGALVHDGWSAYDFIECAHQRCLVHINRDLQKLEVKKGVKPRPLTEPKPPEFGRRGHPPDEFLRFADTLRAILRDAVWFGERIQNPERRRMAADDLQRRFDRLVKRLYHDPETERFAEGLWSSRRQMFTFLRFPGVPWHNNGSERVIRRSVVVRKMSFGSRSLEGARTHAVLRSVEETCARRDLDFQETVRGYLGGNGVVGPSES